MNIFYVTGEILENLTNLDYANDYIDDRKHKDKSDDFEIGM